MGSKPHWRDDFIDDFRQVHVPMVEKVQRSVEVPQVQHGSAVGVCVWPKPWLISYCFWRDVEVNLIFLN